MLNKKLIAAFCNNYFKHTNTMCVQNSELFNIKSGGTCNNYSVFRGKFSYNYYAITKIKMQLVLFLKN
jgi:uncharacterized beta-barrel protein YwiB (DUF1934 family)